jgi:16S rRNA processing protein RimM
MGARRPEHLIVGTVVKPHGIRGELAVRLDTDHPATVFRAGRVLLLGDGRGRPDGRTLTVERSRPFKDGVLVKVREHTSRSAEVDALRGAFLLIPAGEAAPPADDEVFYHEVVGMRVRTAEAEVGTIRELYEAPNGYLLGIAGATGKELLVPFVREMVTRIDREAGLVEIAVPPGLLEL